MTQQFTTDAPHPQSVNGLLRIEEPARTCGCRRVSDAVVGNARLLPPALDVAALGRRDLLAVSGFYNFFRAIPTHKGQGAYHALIGVKILLAFGIFFIASAMVGRSSLAVGMRKDAKKWVGLIVLLGAVIVAISGYAKTALPGRPPAAAVIAD